MKFKGRYKAGVYGYGHMMIHNDGCLYVVYSICKEQIAALGIPCKNVD